MTNNEILDTLAQLDRLDAEIDRLCATVNTVAPVHQDDARHALFLAFKEEHQLRMRLFHDAPLQRPHVGALTSYQEAS
jgi:hypothetical protein